jgi:hypothetical protein
MFLLDIPGVESLKNLGLKEILWVLWLYEDVEEYRR